MRPIPVSFHIGPLVLHLYGLGLAITFFFAAWYLAHRLRSHGYSDSWVSSVAVWTIVSALVGARVVHVVANFSSQYAHHLAQIPQVWNGGLSSFGGLLFGVPTGFLLARRRAREVPGLVLADLVAPVLLAAWTVGRLLGPQLMYAGGGHPTKAWYGMYYAGEVGKRLPVPLFQSALTFAWLLVAWRVEAWSERRGGPRGVVIAAALTMWGTGRYIEEHFWLLRPGHAGDYATEYAGVGFAVIGALWLGFLLLRDRRDDEPEPAVVDAAGASLVTPDADGGTCDAALGGAGPTAPSAAGQTPGGVVTDPAGG